MLDHHIKKAQSALVHHIQPEHNAARQARRMAGNLPRSACGGSCLDAPAAQRPCWCATSSHAQCPCAHPLITP